MIAKSHCAFSIKSPAEPKEGWRMDQKGQPKVSGTDRFQDGAVVGKFNRQDRNISSAFSFYKDRLRSRWSGVPSSFFFGQKIL